MKTFIQLSADSKRVHWKFQRETQPIFAPYITIIDVTGMAPEPQEGWLYDGQTFYPDPGPTAQELAKSALPLLERRLIRALAKFVAGDITKEQLVAFWQQVKAKLLEAGESDS